MIGLRISCAKVYSIIITEIALNGYGMKPQRLYAMGIFEEVKEVTTMQQVAEMFGIKSNRAGFTPCPFHQEKTASMKLYDKSFYCFGCHVGGDVISFTARMLNTSNFEGAKYLAGQLGLSIDNKPSIKAYMMKEKRKKELFEQRQVEQAKDILTDYYRLLWQARSNINDPLFAESLQELSNIEYYLQAINDDGKSFFDKFSKEVEIVARRVDKLNNTG